MNENMNPGETKRSPEELTGEDQKKETPSSEKTAEEKQKEQLSEELEGEDQKELSPKELRKKKQEEKRAENPRFYAVLDWVIVLAVALAVALFINFFVIVNSTVPTGSMETTIMPGSRMLGFRVAYLFSEPKRGDIIVFKFPDDRSQLFVKRIIGLPGETVEIVDGVTYINGEMLEEDYINENYWLSPVDGEDYGPYQVPEGCYFMMGDNRGNSRDSRKWDNTFLERKDIVGKAWLCYWPFSEFGELK